MSFWRLPTCVTGRAQLRPAAPTRLTRQWLILARAAWIVLVLSILGIFFASLPASFTILHQPCTGLWCTDAPGRWIASELQTLSKLGISLDAYAWFWIILNRGAALVWFLVGGSANRTTGWFYWSP
jgi:hypothetical protein